MKIAHLSHTDLDGYACQFVSDFYLRDVRYFNSNYGKEIDEKFAQIIDYIGEEEGVIIITDLNLTLGQCENYEAAVKGRKIKLFLLDHHATGELCARQFAWYYLDTSRCATKITYDFFSAIYGANERLSCFVDVVNAVDIWLKDDPNFELGKVCMGAVASSKEISPVLFPQQHTHYLFYLLSRFCDFVGVENAHIGLDDALHAIKKDYFKFEKDDTLSNMISACVVRLLSEKKDEFSIFYGTHKGLLTYNIGSASVIGNDFLEANPDFDFFLDMTSKKTMSFRAAGKLDVSALAALLVGGGGHVNASGGFFTNFKDTSDYKAIKAQIVDLIAKKSGGNE